MHVKIIRISRSILQQIIEGIGAQSITRCIPYLEDHNLYFIVFITGFNITVNWNGVTFYKEDKKVTINRLSFSSILIM